MADEGCLEDLNVVEESLQKNTSISWIGITSGLLSSLLYAIATIIAKMVTTDAIVISTLRNYIHYFIIFPIIFCYQKPSEIIGPQQSKVFLWLQGFFMALATIFFHLSLGELSAGTTVTLTFIEVFSAPILARLFFKESFTIWDGFFSLFCFFGVILIAKPTFIFHNLQSEKSESSIGVAYGLAAPLFASLSYMLLRQIREKVHFLNSVLSITVCGSILGTILMFFTGAAKLPCSEDVLLIGFVGILLLLAQILFIVALKYERAGTVAILQTPQIIVIYIFQVLVLHDFPSTLSLIGSGLIFGSSVCIGIRKFVNEHKGREKNRKD